MPNKTVVTKKGALKPIVISCIYLAAVFVAIYTISWFKNKPSFVRYKEFGIEIPVNYAIHGIDVSHYQKNIDWQAVKQMRDKNIHLKFAFIKATQGATLSDDKFRRNWNLASDAKLAKGAYHFFMANRDGGLQAENFIGNVNLASGDLPPVLDIEKTYGVAKDLLQQRTKQWLLAVEKEYGVKPIIYTNVNFYENYLAGIFDEYPLWVAHYLVKDKPKIERKWIFWQHNEDGRVNGIDAAVDFNVFNGSNADFEKMLIP
jgi:lysozyme